MKKSSTNLLVYFLVTMIVSALCFTSNSAKASHDKIEPVPEMVLKADRFLDPRFTNIGDFCTQGVLPWSRTAKDNIKKYI